MPEKLENLFKDFEGPLSTTIEQDASVAQTICGHVNKNGEICKSKAGLGTVHTGIGRCIKHTSPSKDVKVISTLKEMLGEENTLRGLLERASQIEESDLKKVDNEIQLLYVLLMAIHKELGDNETISESIERRIKSIVGLLLNAKLTRGRLESLSKVNNAYVVWMIDKWMTILKRVAPDKADIIMNEFLSIVRSVPQEALRTGEVYKSDVNGEVEVKEIW